MRFPLVNEDSVAYLPPDTYQLIERSMPIACVDFVLVREHGGRRALGLILRDSPHGEVWCHLGGRIQRGETIADAIRRHGRETLGIEPYLPLNPQPDYVYEWFPPDIAPGDGTAFGDDPRKHAIGLSFVLETKVGARPANEALDLAYFAPDQLPENLWPGCLTLLERLGLTGDVHHHRM